MLMCCGGFIARNAAAIPDGVYFVSPGEAKAEGDIKLQLQGNVEVGIERRLSREEYQITIDSMANDNDRFGIIVKLPTWKPMTGVAIATGGQIFVNNYSGNYEYNFTDIGSATAAKVAAMTKTKVLLRKCPPHQVSVRFVTDKAVYSKDEPIIVKVEICNRGKESIIVDSDIRGPEGRSNMLQLWPLEGYESEVIDRRGDGKTSVSWVAAVAPGETHLETTERLNAWYAPKGKGTYRFGGTYRLSYWDKTADGKRIVWEEYLGGAFQFKVE